MVLWWRKYPAASFVIPLGIVMLNGVRLDLRVIPLAVSTLLWYALVFTYNNAKDVPVDTLKQLKRPNDPEHYVNPAVTGEIERTTLRYVSFAYAIAIPAIALVLGLGIYTTGVLVLMVALAIVYSGPGRLKESLAAPAVDAFFWTGPALAVFVYGGVVWDILPLSYLAFLGAVGVFEGIAHSIHDHDLDREAGMRTYAIIVGKQRAARFMILSRYAVAAGMVVVSLLIHWILVPVALATAVAFLRGKVVWALFSVVLLAAVYTLVWLTLPDVELEAVAVLIACGAPVVVDVCRGLGK